MLFVKMDVQEQEILLRELESATNEKWFKRLKVISLSAQGYSVSELAEVFDLCTRTIRRFIHRSVRQFH